MHGRCHADSGALPTQATVVDSPAHGTIAAFATAPHYIQVAHMVVLLMREACTLPGFHLQEAHLMDMQGGM